MSKRLKAQCSATFVDLLLRSGNALGNALNRLFNASQLQQKPVPPDGTGRLTTTTSKFSVKVAAIQYAAFFVPLFIPILYCNKQVIL